jgi:dsDNA-specific endonuclease/ATPase MutS2
MLHLKIGDIIVLKNNRTKASILLFIGDRKVKIKDEDAFEYIVNRSDIVAIDKDTDNYEAYGTSFEVKESDLKKDKNRKIFSLKSDSRGRVKIDLHIENLTNYHNQMQNFEIVQMQMNFCKKELDSAMIKQKESLEIIHGIGEGVLKSEVHKLLKLYNLTFFESQNGGSTEVML